MLGERLNKLRRNKGLTLKELGDILNLGESTLSMYENDKRSPDYETLKRIADFFDVSLDYLLGRKDTDIETIAAHHEGDEWTEAELADIEKFKEFVKMRREQKKDK